MTKRLIQTWYQKEHAARMKGREWPFRICGEGVEWFNLKTQLWVWAEGVPDQNGYRMMNWKLPNGKRRFLRLHSVVWITHNGEVPEGMELDHIDGDKSNNSILNLRLVTHAQNIQYGMERLGNWMKATNQKLKPHQIELVLALSAQLPKRKGPLVALALRWGVSKFYLANLRAKAKKASDPSYLSGL